MQNGKKKTVAFHTLGCKLNFSESSEIGRQLEEEGYERVPFGEKADISIVHTCTVTGSADRKTRQAFRKAKQISPDGILVALGCYAQLKSEETLLNGGVDLALGTAEKFDLARFLREYEEKREPIIHACGSEQIDRFYGAHSESERTRAFLKVQDGCDYSCSYCTIPNARGKSRNPQISFIREQARSLIEHGMPEIVLTGVNTGDFGKSTGESFFELIRELDLIEGHHRFRISSIEPNLLTKEIITFTKQSRHFTPHFHIPLQSGSDEILKLMRRRYQRDVFADRVNFIKETMPFASVGADVIVGFPGENEQNFKDACQFLSGLNLSYLHVFTYSERPGTPAANYKGKVPNRIRDERSVILHLLSDEMKKRFYHSQTGTTHWLVPESRSGVSSSGFTENYIETIVENISLEAGVPVQVNLSGINDQGLMSATII